MLFAAISSDGWVSIISTIGSLVLLPLVTLYFKYRLDSIALKQKDIANATGAVPNVPTVVEAIKSVAMEQKVVKEALVLQTEKSQERDEILRDVQQKVNGPHQAALKKVWELLDKKARMTRKQEDYANALTAQKAYTDSTSTSTSKDR